MKCRWSTRAGDPTLVEVTTCFDQSVEGLVIASGDRSPPDNTIRMASSIVRSVSSMSCADSSTASDSDQHNHARPDLPYLFTTHADRSLSRPLPQGFHYFLSALLVVSFLGELAGAAGVATLDLPLPSISGLRFSVT